jgi:hypothetical protein
MFDFAKLAETGQMVVEFINQANARLTSMESVLAEIRADITAHRAAVEPRVENLELAHKEIMGWIAEIEGGEIVEAAAAIETAVVVAETSAAVATAAASEAVAAAESVETPLPEEPVPETSPTPPAETPPAEPAAPAPLEETPIPTAAPPPERKRKFVGL